MTTRTRNTIDAYEATWMESLWRTGSVPAMEKFLAISCLEVTGPDQSMTPISFPEVKHEVFSISPLDAVGL